MQATRKRAQLVCKNNWQSILSFLTRMHSSRMCTSRSLTVSRSIRLGRSAQPPPNPAPPPGTPSTYRMQAPPGCRHPHPSDADLPGCRPPPYADRRNDTRLWKHYLQSIWRLIYIFSGRKPGEGPPGSDGNWPGNGEEPGSGEGSGEGEGEGEGPGVGVGPDGPNGPQLPLGPGRFPITYPLPNPIILKLVKLLPFCDQHMEYTCHVCFDISMFVKERFLSE